MKNKTKKILAGACLGLVGMGCLTGCAMSDEQKKALDLITEKSDEIINLLEDNMSMQNTKLTKEEAAEKILIARNFWLDSKYDVLLSFTQTQYEGLYDKVLGGPVNAKLYINKNENGFRYAETFDDGNDSEQFYIKQDNVNEVYYSWSSGNSGFRQKQYHQAESIGHLHELDILYSFEFGEISSEMIKNLEILEDGSYKFTIYKYECGYDYRSNEPHANRYKLTLTLKNDKFTNFEIESIFLQNQGLPSGLSVDEETKKLIDEPEVVFNTLISYMDANYGSATTISEDRVFVDVWKGSYQYENVDFTEVNEKFAQIEETNLSN